MADQMHYEVYPHQQDPNVITLSQEFVAEPPQDVGENGVQAKSLRKYKSARGGLDANGQRVADGWE